MNSRTPEAELFILFEELLEHPESAEATAKLEALLLASHEARAFYISYLDMHASLSAQKLAGLDTGAAAALLAESPAPHRGASGWRTMQSMLHKPSIVSLASAALFLFASLVFLAVMSGPHPHARSNLHGVRLHSTYQCRFTSLPVMDAAHEQVFNLAEGVAELRYTSGVSAVLAAPAYFVPEKNNAAYLQVGQVVVNVPPHVDGFTLDTPLVRIVDLGTSFAVDVAPDGTTEVHVTKGRVRIEPLQSLVDDWQPVELKAGASLRIAAQQEKLASTPAALGIHQFVTKIPQQQSSPAGNIVHRLHLQNGTDAIDPAGSQQITTEQIGGGASRSHLIARNDFGVLQDWQGFVGWKNRSNNTNVLSIANVQPQVEFKVKKLRGDTFSDDFGGQIESSQHATSGTSCLRSGYSPKPIHATHTLTISFGTLNNHQFDYDQTVEAACLTITNINGGRLSEQDTTRYRVRFLNASGETLYASHWVDIHSGHANDTDAVQRPNAYFAFQVPPNTPPLNRIARIVVVEERRGAADSGNMIGIDDFGFTTKPTGDQISN